MRVFSNQSGDWHYIHSNVISRFAQVLLNVALYGTDMKIFIYNGYIDIQY